MSLEQPETKVTLEISATFGDPPLLPHMQDFDPMTPLVQDSRPGAPLLFVDEKYMLFVYLYST